MAQMAEKRALKYDEMVRYNIASKLHLLSVELEEVETSRALEYEREIADRLEAERKEKAASSRFQQKIDLQNQLKEQEQRHQEAYAEFLKDKMMVDEIVKKIYEEDRL
ncbi:unnamed protein product [Protopolystoma xenopodis]|uniref:Meiosis-specific nuclear structural protein 1 n=1 Tax=Protopolystoma xenopodis TaxID=117903 RepID=A0A448XAQ7_9PLAT|nr:unnamed protein product [Protopolystoma xenopodis]